MLYIAGLELFESNEVGIWIHIMIERIIVVKIYSTIYKKTNKQTNKQGKRKQAYARVDLDLDDS